METGEVRPGNKHTTVQAIKDALGLSAPAEHNENWRKMDELLASVRPGEAQCSAYKNELQKFDADGILMQKLMKGELVDLYEAGRARDRSLLAYAGHDSLRAENRKGTYGNRPKIAAGEGTSDLMETPVWDSSVKEVFAESVPVVVRNHVEIGDLNIAKIMEERGIPKDTPLTLLNFDAHSDIYVNRQIEDGKENIGNWVNVMLMKNPNIKDFYWVMPNDFKDKPEYSHYYYSGKNKDRVLADSAADRTLYVNNKTGAFVWDEKPQDFSESEYRTVGIHKRALEDMPELSGKQIISSLDIDALANKGYDTALKAKTDWKGDAGIQEWLETYKKAGIKPFLSVISMSPEYVKDEALPRLEQLAWNMVSNSSTGKDLLATPFRNYINPSYNSPDGHHHGFLTMRYEHPVYQLLSKLHEVDQATRKPDGALSLKKEESNEELKAVLEKTAELYKTTPNKAYELLRNYAKNWKFDKVQSNDVLNFGWVEEMLRHSCQQGFPKPQKAG